MRPMLLAFLAIAVITAGAWYGLERAGFSSSERLSGDAVRLN
ncbi:MAG: hypothetical protein QNJ13_04545 [Paracoccaceae bacterium]|nr:hypothetical protein [Paracoccaceae bacterium]